MVHYIRKDKKEKRSELLGEKKKALERGEVI